LSEVALKLPVPLLDTGAAVAATVTVWLEAIGVKTVADLLRADATGVALRPLSFWPSGSWTHCRRDA
jgi:hypothetical protein